MSYAITSYTASGTTANFAVGLDYITQSDINVRVNGVIVPFTWVDDSNLRLNLVPTFGSTVEVFRTTDITLPAIDFVDGSTFTADDLDASVRQSLFSVQEMQDTLSYWITWLQANAAGTGTGVSALPPIVINDNGSFLVATGGLWTVTSLANTKTLLGLSTTLPVKTAAYHDTGVVSGSIPLFENFGSAAFIASGTAIGQVPVNSHVGVLGTAAYGTIGTAAGNVLAVADLGGGVPGFPAISGAAITSVIHNIQVVHAQYRTTYASPGGAYGTAGVGQTVLLNSLIWNECGAVLTGGNYLDVLVGGYLVEGSCVAYAIGKAYLKVMQYNGTAWVEVTRGPVVDTTGGQTLTVSTKLYTGITAGVRLDVVGSSLNAANTAMGTPSGVSGMGANVFGSLTLTRYY